MSTQPKNVSGAGDRLAGRDLEEKVRPLLQEMLARLRRYRDTPLREGIDSAAIAQAALQTLSAGPLAGESSHFPDLEIVQAILDGLIGHALRDEQHPELERHVPAAGWLDQAESNGAGLATWLEHLHAALRATHSAAVEVEVQARLENFRVSDSRPLLALAEDIDDPDAVRRCVMAQQSAKSPSQSALTMVVYVMLGGFVVALYSLSAATWAEALRTACVGLMIAGAAALVGGLLGFLFGIPRALQSDEAPAPQPGAAKEGDHPTVSYKANTNLEQISDWLTKILVGVGLTQLAFLPDNLYALAAFLGPALGAVPQTEVMAGGVVLSFAVCGFLFGYLWTRLYMAGALREADLAALDRKISELERQTSRDAKALSLVQLFLNPRPDSPQPQESELKAAVAAASPAMKTTIFNEAYKVSSNNWQDDATKPRMERTIPIFRALIESDLRNEYHMNHGQGAWQIFRVLPTLSLSPSSSFAFFGTRSPEGPLACPFS
jgi:hypothetical protein